MSNAAVVIENYTKIIKKKTVLSEINVSLERGKIFGLYGHNGSGKTMLLRAVSGLIYPTKGCVTVFGEKLGERISFPESLGIVIENVGFWPYYTGLVNLRILASIKKKISEEKIRDSIVRVGLDPDDKRVYGKYSLGMKQRLGIAQAVMEKPDLILLDEPTNALDDEGIERAYQIIREENERGATIVIASHDKDVLRSLCSRCYKMANGQLAEGDIPG